MTGMPVLWGCMPSTVRARSTEVLNGPAMLPRPAGSGRPLHQRERRSPAAAATEKRRPRRRVVVAPDAVLLRLPKQGPRRQPGKSQRLASQVGLIAVTRFGGEQRQFRAGVPVGVSQREEPLEA